MKDYYVKNNKHDMRAAIIKKIEYKENEDITIFYAANGAQYKMAGDHRKDLEQQKVSCEIHFEEV